MNDKTQEANAEQKAAQLSIQKIYIKDMSFEAPNAPVIFREEWKPAVDIQLANKGEKLGEDIHEVTLTVTVTVKFGDKIAYLIEVQQAGIFQISGFDEERLNAVLATVCPNILFPYVREAISDLAVRGGFPQFLLNPVNFDAIYAQELKRQKEADAPSQTH